MTKNNKQNSHGNQLHPVEKSMMDSCMTDTHKQSSAAEAAKQSLKYDKDLNRSFPEGQTVTTGKDQVVKKESEDGS